MERRRRGTTVPCRACYDRTHTWQSMPRIEQGESCYAANVPRLGAVAGDPRRAVFERAGRYDPMAGEGADLRPHRDRRRREQGLQADREQPGGEFPKKLEASGASFSQMFGEEHNSEGNYFWLFSGADQGVGWNDDMPAHQLTTRQPRPTAHRSSPGRQKMFAGYSEDLPAIGSEQEFVRRSARAMPASMAASTSLGSALPTSSMERPPKPPTFVSRTPEGRKRLPEATRRSLRHTQSRP